MPNFRTSTSKKEKKTQKNMSNCVTNGCSGKCCENFTMPYSIDELKEAIKQIKEQGYYVNRLGNKKYHKVVELENVLDMVIPLGLTNIDPQTGMDFAERHQKLWNVSIDSMTIASREHFIREGNTLKANTYTCRHFNKEKRICNNYENRPQMCRHFGQDCHYSGCNYKTKFAEERLAQIAELDTVVNTSETHLKEKEA